MLPHHHPRSSSLDLQGAFAQLSRRGFKDGSLGDTLRELTAATGRILNIERTSLWGLTNQHTTLECIDLYELSRDRHSAGTILRSADYPQYFRAIESSEPIVADDALKHPSTQEFIEDHLLMHGISALIVSPIHINGELQGALCIERVGSHSAWTSVERLFAHAVASLVGLALLQHQLLMIEEELRDANNMRRALFTSAREAILISDADTGNILDANPQAEKLFGQELRQLLGDLESQLPVSSEEPDIRHLLKLLADAKGSQPLCSKVIASDGTVIPVEMTRQLVELETGKKIVQDVFRPVTEKADDA